MVELLTKLVNESFPEVSRETIGNLSLYLDLLGKWNNKINLVSRKTSIEELISRHLLDSLQLKKYILNQDVEIFDLGTGAGFPGLVLAIAGYNCSLIEINEKKAAFLQEVCFQLKLKTKIFNKDFKSLSGFKADYITSRAVSSLKQLILSCAEIISPTTVGLFLKSKNQLNEPEELAKFWSFKLQLHKNIFNNDGVIIELSKLTPWEK